MKPLLLICTLLAFLGLRASGLEPGAPLPDLTVPGDNGQPLSLRQTGSTGYLLVYFYPKADTPGCTAQACSLRDANAELQEKGVHILGVSADPVPALSQFREKYSLPFPLLSDVEGTLMEAFHVPRIGSFAKRQAFLFKDGILVWKDTAASTKEQGSDVLQAIADLEKKS